MGQWQAVEPLTVTERARAITVTGSGENGLEETEMLLRARLPDLFNAP